MIAGIVGLGLIGGSFAKAYHQAGWQVLAHDLDRSTLDFAMLEGTVSAPLTADDLRRCDLVLLAVPPAAAVDYLTENGPHIGRNTVVIDCCGTKQAVCDACFPLAAQYGFTYLGGHPMAGSHHSGYKYARGNLFHRSPMVIVPPDHNNIVLLDRVKTLLAPAEFGAISVTTAREHDRTIAFTSQMAHLVSNAYIKSPTAADHKGFSAGSYKDLTRVAWLDPAMWTELFLDNREFLLQELEALQENLEQYRQALANRDAPALTALLEEGRRRKEEVDGR